MSGLEVEVISHTMNPLNTIYLACRQCYYDGSIIDFNIDSLTEEKKEQRIGAVIDSGHHSVLEHVSFTFAIKNVTRALSHQLVRHRIASYSQQSQRYVDASNIEFSIPKKIEKNEEALKKFNSCIEMIKKTYSDLKELGIENEDARSVLPNAAYTNIVVTMNCRALLHFFSERCCSCAQDEIKIMAYQMLNSCKKILPIVFKSSGPKCLALGYCNENKNRSCGLRPLKIN